MLKLQRKQFNGQGIEVFALKTGSNRTTQARGEAGEFFIHAVFVRGWFSATAGVHNNRH